MASAARQDVHGRSRGRTHHRRQGTEGLAFHREALSRMDRAHPHQARRPAGTDRASRREHDTAARSPAGIRLYAGGPQVHPRPDGAERRRRDRFDGQRQPARRALRQEQAALQLLQTALRAGHQSTDRPDPRRSRDVARILHRTKAEPLGGRRDQPAASLRSQPARAELRPDADDPLHFDVTRAASFARARSTSPTRSPGAAGRSKRGSPACVRRRRTWCARVARS